MTIIKQKRIYGIYKDDKGIIEEDFLCDYEQDPLSAYNKVLDSFNSNLRPYESKRISISARWEDEEIKEFFYCDFEKINMMSQKDSKGYYDRWRCRNCGKVRRRYGLEGHEITKVTCGKLKGMKKVEGS